jgi:transcriptional regulator with XRE-family HTH domain
MTQQQVADSVGISTPYYSQIENGSRTASGYVLARIIEALETTGDYILFGRFPDVDDSLKQLFDRSTDGELAVIRRFLDSFSQKLNAAETDREAATCRSETESTTPAYSIP